MKMLLLDFKFSGVLIPYRELERKKKSFLVIPFRNFYTGVPLFLFREGKQNSACIYIYIYIYISKLSKAFCRRALMRALGRSVGKTP